jgi:hypothetical protein
MFSDQAPPVYRFGGSSWVVGYGLWGFRNCVGVGRVPGLLFLMLDTRVCSGLCRVFVPDLEIFPIRPTVHRQGIVTLLNCDVDNRNGVCKPSIV